MSFQVSECKIRVYILEHSVAFVSHKLLNTACYTTRWKPWEGLMLLCYGNEFTNEHFYPQRCQCVRQNLAVSREYMRKWEKWWVKWKMFPQLLFFSSANDSWQTRKYPSPVHLCLILFCEGLIADICPCEIGMSLWLAQLP